MKKHILLCIFIHSSHAATIFIENWGTHPVTISELTVPMQPNDNIIHTAIDIQPGQSMPINIPLKNETYSNFNQITINFIANEYKKTETIYFPNEATQQTSLSFSDTGYKRVPFNILTKK